jgi:membrane-associated phospholipid phosphatase
MTTNLAREISWKRCLASESGVKALLFLVLPVLFGIPYFYLQHIAPPAPHLMQACWLDRLIRFDPEWTPVYQSIYLLLPIPVWLSLGRAELGRYVKGFLILSGTAFLTFLLVPTAVPRPMAPANAPFYAILVNYDAETNAFPSLHAGLVAYTLLFASKTLRSRILQVLLNFWGVSIFYACLATKQHVAVDVLAGALLAWICHQYAWRTPMKGADL